MQTSDFSYYLPDDLIAQHPLPGRTSSRLLNVNADSLSDFFFNEIPALLRPADLLVFNNTRVIPARLFGEKETGGRVEVLVERVLSEHRVKAMLRASKSPAAGSTLRLEGAVDVRVIGRIDEFYELEFNSDDSALAVLQQYGHMPLPPYIGRVDDHDDRERYQTVYASKPGAVAAPTAGLHFDEDLMTEIQENGPECAWITLHVGAGTFQPVRVDNIEEHKMHSEYAQVSAEVCEAVERCRQRNGRVVAVGTTTVRSLETAAAGGMLKPFEGETDIFIMPGYEFRVVDALITNFHLPESTLLMLVCAFAGYTPVMRAYRHAVEQRYRFYSYGDAMFLTKHVTSSNTQAG